MNYEDASKLCETYTPIAKICQDLKLFQKINLKIEFDEDTVTYLDNLSELLMLFEPIPEKFNNEPLPVINIYMYDNIWKRIHKNIKHTIKTVTLKFNNEKSIDIDHNKMFICSKRYTIRR